MSLYADESRVDFGDDDVPSFGRAVLRPTTEWMTEERESTPLITLLRSGQAACATSDLPAEAWFPQGRPSNAVVLVCLSCPVRRLCRTAAEDEFGVWAGLNRERRVQEVWTNPPQLTRTTA